MTDLYLSIHICIQVRAAAVTALAKFGAQCPDLQPSIEVLLGRCLLDTDDEVRDRATYYLAVLKTGSTQLTSAYILNGLQVVIIVTSYDCFSRCLLLDWNAHYNTIVVKDRMMCHLI